MPDADKLDLEIDFSDAELDPEQLENLTQTLFRQLHGLAEVDDVERPREAPPEDVVKGGDKQGRTLPGKLLALVTRNRA